MSHYLHAEKEIILWKKWPLFSLFFPVLWLDTVTTCVDSTVESALSTLKCIKVVTWKTKDLQCDRMTDPPAAAAHKLNW